MWGKRPSSAAPGLLPGSASTGASAFFAFLLSLDLGGWFGTRNRGSITGCLIWVGGLEVILSFSLYKKQGFNCGLPDNPGSSKPFKYF